MSDRNVELTRRFTEAYNARDVEALISCCDPSIELYSTFAAVGGANYHRHDGVRTFFEDMEEAWGDEIRSETEAYFDLGEHTLAFVVFHGRGRASGAEVAMPAAVVFRCRDGLIAYAKGFIQRDDALRDLGVSEDELEPIDP